MKKQTKEIEGFKISELFDEGADKIFNPKRTMARGERNHYHMAFVKLMNTVKPIEFIKKEVNNIWLALR